MVMAHESRFVADHHFGGVRDYAKRYTAFLDEMTNHQKQFLAEWRRQQEILSRLEDEGMRQSQCDYMERLRASSVDVVDKAVERFTRALAWESRRNESGAEAT